MTEALMFVAGVVLVVVLVFGFRLGERQQVARTRYYAWRAAVKSVPVAFRAFRDSVVVVAGFWLWLLGSSSVLLLVAWRFVVS